ncbi:MAG TPA: hypothetical protein VJK52_04870 [Candidatus Nanoarchaeia archaeon]|nr:hypothetical protein [Candidatus Nanoarchaeia archaeon]
MVLLVFLERVFGYFPGNPGWEVAEIAVSKGKGVEECKQILGVPWIGMGPSTSEQRRDCILEYAKLSKDPFVCELLMPSEYGFSCLGEVEGKLFAGEPCYYSAVRKDVYCNSKYSEGELTIDNPQIEKCSNYQRKDLQEWCYLERTKRLNGIRDCDSIEKYSVLKDDCEFFNALKEKDSKLCASIQDSKRRNYCVLRVDVAIKYPNS